MQLFYNENLDPDAPVITFTKDESRHTVKVLRKNIGDQLYITNGKGYLFTAKLTLATPNKCEAQIIKKDFFEKPKLHIHLAVAPTKMNDRFEWFLEKATEIGISEITPIICNHSERKTVKSDRFKRIIVTATKQSLRYHAPILNNPISFDAFVAKKQQNTQCFIAHCEDFDKTSLKEALKTSAHHNFLLLIGPEGDFSVPEIEKALQNNYQPVSLGEQRLRTETAAIVATHSIVFQCGE